MKKESMVNYTIIKTKWMEEIKLYGNKKLMHMHILKTIKEINPDYNEEEFIKYQILVNKMNKLKDKKEIKIYITKGIETEIRIGQKYVTIGNTTNLDKNLKKIK